MADVKPPPSVLLHPIKVPKRTLLGPGPSNAYPRVLAAGAMPLLGHLHPEFLEIMDECKAGIQYLFQTSTAFTMAASGTGHAAMEMACVNMVDHGSVVLVAANGFWADRFTDMCQRQGADVRCLVKVAAAFSLEEIGQAIAQHKPQVMFITHGDSSTSVLQPLEGMGELCHSHDCILIVDSVAAAGGVPLFMDKWGIDVLYTGAQKVIGAPPGVSPIAFSERAWRRISSRKSKPSSFYFDAGLLANYWGCSGERKYHHTAPISSMYALREGLAVLAAEGLTNSWLRHAHCAELLRQGLQNDRLSLKLYNNDKGSQLPTITAVEVPPDVDWKHVCSYVMTRHSIEISGGLGPSAGKIWRIGLMGYNATEENVHAVLDALHEAIQEYRSCKRASL